MPIGGGGSASVNGRPYAIRSGQYYLFSGNLNVNISTNNPGSMGHWSVCISADREPAYGNGNNRPKSPCESQNDDKSKKKDDRAKAKDDDESKTKGNRAKTKDDGKSKTKDDDRSKANDDERSNRKANDRTTRTGSRR